MRWRWTQATIVLAILIPLLWSFGSTLTGARICAYRDTAHFYYPLYAWTTRCWSRGEIPLWNPQENIGTPVAAEATSAVFYPGQLIFALPWDYSLKFNLYLLAHLVLAVVGAYALARQLLDRGVGTQSGASLHSEQAATERADTTRLRQLAAGLCGLSYAFSGAVLFQYCNLVFLVGAAWLPFALLAADRMLITRRLTWACILGACLALMVLGGDPQMAYHTGLLVTLLAWLRRRANQHPASQPDTVSAPALPRHRHALALLAIAAIVGVLLSTVQVVPALSLTRSSERTITDDSRGVVERLFGKAPRETHASQRYAFSVAPWRVVECAWPNVNGHMFPIHQRWLSALRGEDRVWTPTLYLGLMPLLIALTLWRLRTRDCYVRWLSLVALGALIASFGWYGLGWLAAEQQRFWTGAPPTIAVGEPTGGLYWLMVELLPGYGLFRYPAKLLVVASLATSALAGLGLEQALTAGRPRLCRWLVVLASCSILGGLAFLTCGPWWSSWFAAARPDELYGPFDAHGAWLGCLTACGHTTVLCGLFWWLLRKTAWSPSRLAQAIVIITAIELAWANGSHVLTAPADLAQATTVLDAIDQQSDVPGNSTTAEKYTRIYRRPQRRWGPQQWLETSDPKRGEQTLRWDHATLLPKYHLLGELGSIHSMNTMIGRDYRTLLRIASEDYPPASVVNLLGVRYLVLPENIDWANGIELPDEAPGAANAKVWRNPAALPHVWMVHQVDNWRKEDLSQPHALEQRLRRLLLPTNPPRDWRHSAVVEITPPFQLELPSDGTEESCRVVAERACSIEIEATLTSPGLLVLSNQYDAGWSVEISSDASHTGGDIVRTNCVMQGVFLPAGTHQLVFQYAPQAFYEAAGVSIISWLLLLALVVSQKMRK